MKKKVAIITGASEGLGKAISIKLASKKYITVLASRDKKKLQNTSSDISKVSPNSAVPSIENSATPSSTYAVVKL